MSSRDLLNEIAFVDVLFHPRIFLSVKHRSDRGGSMEFKVVYCTKPSQLLFKTGSIPRGEDIKSECALPKDLSLSWPLRPLQGFPGALTQRWKVLERKSWCLGFVSSSVMNLAVRKWGVRWRVELGGLQWHLGPGLEKGRQYPEGLGSRREEEERAQGCQISSVSLGNLVP